VVYSLDRIPKPGLISSWTSVSDATGSAYATVATLGWTPGTYQVTVDVPATASCQGATDSAILTVVVPGMAIEAGGAYSANGVAVSFGFEGKRTAESTLTGEIEILQRGRWMLSGAMTSFTKTSPTTGSVAGIGSLYQWDPSLAHGRGGWKLVKTRVAVTIGYVDVGPSTAVRPDQIAVSISYTPASGPPLPTTSLTPLTKGNIKS
jgi:hypothetical protein